MKLHHQKHHQAYVNGLNAAEETYAKSDSTKEKIVLQSALKFNGGGEQLVLFSEEKGWILNLGHINHSLFWKNLAPADTDGGKLADGPLKTAIERDFGSVEGFKKKFNATTAAIQGSGWGWLVRFFPFPLDGWVPNFVTSGIQRIFQEAWDCYHCKPGSSDLYVLLAAALRLFLAYNFSLQHTHLSLVLTSGNTFVCPLYPQKPYWHDSVIPGFLPSGKWELTS